MELTTQQIAEMVQGRLVGPADLRIDSMERLDRAGSNQLTLIGSDQYARQWPGSAAAAALVAADLEMDAGPGRALIMVPDVDLASARVLGELTPSAGMASAGIDPAAVIDPEADVAPTASIGPGCYVGPGVRIGDKAVLKANVTVLQDASIGADCILWPGAVVCERCRIGDRSIVHPNATIGAAGFGVRPGPGGRDLVTIPHIGSVQIGQDVEVGAGTCIDRGKFADTEVGDGTKIDNLVQIAHNCRIGRNCIICGKVGIAGSVTIGDGAVLGGAVGIRDHLTIGAGAQIAAYAAVMNDVPDGATWAGYPAQEAKMTMREVAAVRKLPDLLKKFKRLID
ncbi:MAG: UDP-3-O-(3-hydroxymyristoyl)glucosamine N-acyltransferase [Phycisphaerae bacterium]|nr:UDP-3-O-(3-hydroxymyristoyl)glucosamine N-acyltransferase [Phycisphaerae bacterium]